MQQQVFGDQAFSAGTQVQFLNLMAHSEDFFNYAYAIPVTVTDFTVPACQLVFEVLSEYYRKYSHAPKLGTLDSMVTEAVHGSGKNVQTELTPEEYDSLGQVMEQIHRPPELDVDYGQATLYQYVKTVRTKQIMARYSDAVVRGVGAEDMLKELSAIDSLRPPQGNVQLFSLLGDAANALVYNTEELAMVPTGIMKLDAPLGGGLSALRQDLGIGVACTGIGKTNMLLNFALGAAEADIFALLITLELTTGEMMQRAVSMAAHINARHATRPVDTWDPDERLRFEALQHTRILDHVQIAEIRNKQCTMSDICGIVEEWKRQTRRKYGSDEKCRLVLVDWMDLLSPDLRENKRAGREQAEWAAMGQVCQDFKRMQATFGVACWTVTQGGRNSVSADKLRMDHVATSFQKLWYVSTALGLTAPLEDKYVDQHVDDDNMAASSIMDCNRQLTLTIMKNRSGPKHSMQLYQGPTLRFWPEKAMWYATEDLLARGDMQKIFGHLKP